MKRLVLLTFVLFPTFGWSQITFSEHIAPIIYNKCTPCHRPGEIGPMSFTGYNEVVAYGSMISFTTQAGIMPPWQPDKNYSTLLDERGLTAQEIADIASWVNNGMPRGNVSLEPPLPNFPTGSQLGQPDLVLSMSQAYQHQGNNQDMYRVFVLPVNLPADKSVKAIEFRPGNKKIVHHAILGLDTSGQGRIRDNNAPGYGYTSFSGFGFTPVEDTWYGWAPGTTPRYYPSNIGKRLFRNADVLVQMHYAPYPTPESDSSSVNIFFDNNNQVSRHEIIAPLSPINLMNGPFVIPANTVKSFKGRLHVPAAISLISAFPHMHLLGSSWKIYAVKPGNDTVNLIQIPEWDFNWQGFYHFPRLVKLPANSWLYAEATFDNTTNNPYNPNDPPINVSWGESTTDEMYLTYFSYVPYQTGDENIAISTPNELAIQRMKTKMYPVYPNPASGEVKLAYMLGESSDVAINLLDLNGKRVKNLLEGKRYLPGQHQISFSTAGLSPGVYLIQLTTGQEQSHQKLIVN